MKHVSFTRAAGLPLFALVVLSTFACGSTPDAAPAPAPADPSAAAPQDFGPEVPYDNTPSTGGDTPMEVTAMDVALPVDYVRVPHGAVHKSCFHELVDGDVVQPDGSIKSVDGSLTSVGGACAFTFQKSNAATSDAVAGGGVQPPTDNGWTESANWTSPVAIKRFSAQFHVPAAPRVYTNQLIYMFPALEDVAGTSIVQPVLQYGNNGAWGGNYWTIASWLGGGAWGGHYYYSAARRVSTGEVISGLMYDTGNCHPAGCEWAVAMHDSSNTRNITISGLADLSWRWVFAGAIEVYNVNSCAKYPATYDNFYNFAITDYGNHRHTATWRHDIGKHTCGEKITSNAGLVNLYY
jgi:hypothetical protein